MRDLVCVVLGALFSLAGLAAQAATALTVTGMPDDAPLVVTASHDGAKLLVVADLKEGWHLYGRDVGGGKPVAVTITGGAFTAAGPLATPMGADGLIVGKAELSLPLRRTGDGQALVATMSFMVCDALMCLPPVTLELRGGDAARPAGPARVLLVAIDDGERTQRIAKFLTARGFAPTVTTYADVTAEQCDAADVVIADSPTFGQVQGKKVPFTHFPKTSSPVVAVGFGGTRVLEANKVAMACGYI